MQVEEILEWARSRGILDKGNMLVQTLKLQEEVGELSKAVLYRSQSEIDDAIGDIIIVLVSLAYFNGGDVESCVRKAFEEVSKRKGSMINGNFVKNSTPKE
jgi:NTP pyrophosphatase (non-canonical NTP hydrolase)